MNKKIILLVLIGFCLQITADPEKQEATFFEEIKQNEYAQVGIIAATVGAIVLCPACIFPIAIGYKISCQDFKEVAADILVKLVQQQLRQRLKDNNVPNNIFLQNFAPAMISNLALSYFFPEKADYYMAEDFGKYSADIWKQIAPTPLTQDLLVLTSKNVAGILLAQYKEDKEKTKAYAVKAILEPAMSVYLLSKAKNADDMFNNHLERVAHAGYVSEIFVDHLKMHNRIAKYTIQVMTDEEEHELSKDSLIIKGSEL